MIRLRTKVSVDFIDRIVNLAGAEIITRREAKEFLFETVDENQGEPAIEQPLTEQPQE